MGMDLFFLAILLLAVFAVFDLIVGVSNDAVNFLNSSIGSRVAPRRVILIIASLGILAGVGFSSGMMEVARKGIFHPQLFTMPELITLFLAVMLADVILLDIFNSFGLPTSTTVSIVFELLGAAVAVSALKIYQAEGSLKELSNYINSSRAMLIILGILLSVAIAFVAGTLAQILSRLLFTFDYRARLRRYGGLWGGVALTSITYFILVKGAKGTAFTPPETVEWIQENTLAILLGIFVVSGILLQGLALLKVNVLKPIVLIGTFALAMAFAANDLMNFIGVPMAGYHAYQEATTHSNPLEVSMEALEGKVPSETVLLLVAGLVMVLTLWFSRKSRSVAKTEIHLARHEEGEERFESIFLSRAIVRMVLSLFRLVWRVVPGVLGRRLARRLQRPDPQPVDDEKALPFDLLRASVNLMVASAVISYATSQKLPLSTTYVTFMVAMGTSFADMAWGRDSAVYRVTGVLTVVGGWFMTAIMATTISFTFAIVIFYTEAYGVLALLGLAAFVLWQNHRRHQERTSSSKADEVFNLKDVENVRETVSVTFEQMGLLIQEIRVSLDAALEALFSDREEVLAEEQKRAKRIQRWTNIITANIFKALRLLQRESADISFSYAQTTRRLQKLADGHRDLVVRASRHVRNHHKGLLPVQVKELRKVKELLHDLLLQVEATVKKEQPPSRDAVAARFKELTELAELLNQAQIARIEDGASKTRLSILYYAIVGNALMLGKQTLRLLGSFEESFSGTKREGEFDLD